MEEAKSEQKKRTRRPSTFIVISATNGTVYGDAATPLFKPVTFPSREAAIEHLLAAKTVGSYDIACVHAKVILTQETTVTVKKRK